MTISRTELGNGSEKPNISAGILTIKLITKTGEKFELTWADKLLLIYF